MEIYGTTQGVAALVPQYASNRDDEVDFSSRSRPTQAQLIRWMEQITSMFNTSLRSFGFATPVIAEYEEPYNAITMLVEQFAATLVEGINGYQRAAKSKNSGWSVIAELENIRKLIWQWLIDNSNGLEDGGLPRPVSDLGSMHTRSGETTIFRRNQYDGIDTAE